MNIKYNGYKKIFLTIIIILFTMISSSVFAVCPVCTIAVGIGIGFSRWLGIDDTITGLWIGGLTVSLIMWTIFWFDKKNIRFFGRNIITIVAYYFILVVPLYSMGLIGHPLNTLWGIDKILLGTLIGSFAFFMGAMGYCFLKKKNDGHAYFPFQKVIMPIVPLLILSFVFYFIVK